jgi:putative peptidoglycan lipid II flippase
MAGLKDTLSFGLRVTLFITIPAMAGLIVCSTPIFSLIFMGGAFDYTKVVNSAQALMLYSLGLTSVAMTRVLAPAFYALKDTKTPVVTAFITFLLNLGLSLALMGPLKHGGLALATTLSATVNMLLLLWLIRRAVGTINGRALLVSCAKSVTASLPMAAAVWYACSFIDWSHSGEKLLKGCVVGGAIAVGTIIYIVVVSLLGSTEARDTMQLLRKKMGKG